MAPPGGVQTPPSPPRKIKKAIYENHNPTIISYTENNPAAQQVLSDRQGQPKNVGVAVKIESHAKVSYKGGRILKLSDKVTMTRAFTARKKNRPAILFFS